MADRGELFIQLYNELDHWLKKLSERRGSVPFWKRIREAAKREPALNRYLDDLLEFHELRNAIIHHRSYPAELLAMPTQETVDRMQMILDKLLRPQLVGNAFKSDVHVFGPATMLLGSGEGVGTFRVSVLLKPQEAAPRHPPCTAGHARPVRLFADAGRASG